jgi:hypothetical protein
MKSSNPIHYDGSWGCASYEKKGKNWSLVNCDECLNHRHNGEMSLQVGYASFLLSGADLKQLQKATDKLDPNNIRFRKENFSEDMKRSWRALCKISESTTKLKTAQQRLNYVRALPENSETYLIKSTARCWFSKLK